MKKEWIIVIVAAGIGALAEYWILKKTGVR